MDVDPIVDSWPVPAGDRPEYSAQTLRLADGSLHGFMHVHPLGGRTTTHPRDASGYGSVNCYLIRERDHALLIDCGFTSHAEHVVRQLDQVLDDGVALSLFPTSLQEMHSVCNARAIASHFDLSAVYATHINAASWIDFMPARGAPAVLADVATRRVRSTDRIDVHPDGARPIEAFFPMLRLLPTFWLYDERTRTLFSSDAFTWLWRARPDGPWAATSPSDVPTLEEALDYMTRTRFWWLPGADVTPIQEGLEAVFRRFDVEIIAPHFGCVLAGRDVVRSHYSLLQRTLEAAGRMDSIGLDAGRVAA